MLPLLSSSPFPLLLQKVGEVVAFVHVVCVFAFLGVQLLDGMTVALLGEQQLTQHPPVRLPVLLLQTLQLGNTDTQSYPSRECNHTQGPWTHKNRILFVVVFHA